MKLPAIVLATLILPVATQAADLTQVRRALMQGDCDGAVQTLNSAISAGDVGAMNQLAGMHLVGNCVKQDVAAATALYEKAAAAGSERAQKMLERAKG